MRIYDLAKSIGQTFNTDVKSSTLADEFKTLPEFEEIRESIKSHSSSVDDKYAKLMYDIYRARQAKSAPAPKAPAAPLPPRQAPSVQAPPLRPSVPAAAPRPPVVIKRPSIPLAAPPRPAPLRPNLSRPAMPPPPPPPVRSTPPPAPPARPQAPAAPPPGQGRPPGAPPAQTVQAVPPKAQKPRPSGLASELKSSTGTTGVTAEPARGGAGQPSAPAMPKFSSDSLFARTLRGEKPRPAREDVPPQRTGDSRGRSDGPGRPSRDGAPPAGGPAALPEIGQMKLAKGKRHRPAPAPTTVAKPGVRRGAKETEADEKAKAAKKTLRPSKVYSDPEQFRRAPSRPVKGKRGDRMQHAAEALPEVPVGPVIITGPLTTGELAQKMGVAAGELIKNSFMKGKAITINQLIDLDLAEELAIEMDIDLRIELEGDESDLAEFGNQEGDAADLQPRPPVVTIMGHVDHGKTSVLDYFRKSRVMEGEFGGITQHIGAYHVDTKQGAIVFLDTPGHEAFTAMRARGVKSTDIAVLVVAADDGVMPQTIESINHAKAAGVPLIVAINKIDLPQADPDRVRKELMQHSVLAAALGGDTEFVEISAKKGTNMDALLEVISLQAQILDLKSNPKRRAQGVVIESHVDPQRGAVATILVQHGTLKVGDFFVVGAQSGRVRLMVDDLGKTVKEGKLSIPVELIGLSGTPEVGETLLQMDSERQGREIAERRGFRRRLLELGTTRHVTLEGLHDQISQGEIKELNVILRADVQGSIEAIEQSFKKLAADAIRIRVLHNGTGPVSESDVSLAAASNAIIIGFNVRPESGAADLAAREGVEIKTYRIIYELFEDIENAMLGMVDRKFQEQTQGRVEIRQIFNVTKYGTIAGCMVVSGEVTRGAKARLVRDGTVVYQGAIASIRRLKEDVQKVSAGYECGIALERYSDYKPGDVIETFVMEQLPAQLVRS